jgi:hypothetical protein
VQVFEKKHLVGFFKKYPSKPITHNAIGIARHWKTTVVILQQRIRQQQPSKEHRQKD